MKIDILDRHIMALKKEYVKINYSWNNHKKTSRIS